GPRPSQDRDRRMSGPESALQRSLRTKSRLWGGWLTGPTALGPEEFARAGYDYVGFDAQHGYLDDADIAGMLRRIEHVPVGTAVRLPNADAAPIGRGGGPTPLRRRWAGWPTRAPTPSSSR